MKSVIIGIMVCLGLVAMLIQSCNKTQDKPPPPPPIDSASTYFLDSNVYLLKDLDLATGVFHYQISNPGSLVIKKGDFFIEPRHFGYLRKIDNIKLSNDDLYLYSEPANLSDAFKRYGDFNGKFSIPSSLNPFSNLSPRLKHAMVSSNSSTRINGAFTTLGVFPDFTVSIPGLDLTFKSFAFNFNPVFNVSFKNQNQSFSLGIDSTTISCGYYVNIQKPNAGSLNINDTFHLQNYFPADISNLFARVPITSLGPNALPVFGDISIDLLLVVNYNSANTISDGFAVGQQRAFAMNMNYQNGSANGQFQYTIQFDDIFYNNQLTDNSGMAALFSIIPVYKINFYNTTLAKIRLSNTAYINLESSQNPVSWDEMSRFSVQGQADIVDSILSPVPGPKQKITSSELFDTVYTAPSRIVPTGPITAGKPGDNVPYSLSILDSRGTPLSFPTTIYYSTDLGSWQYPTLVSSPNSATATNNFTFGAGPSNVQVSVKDVNNNVQVSLNTIFALDTAVSPPGLNLVSVGPYPVPGAVPGFGGNAGSVNVGSGSLVFPQNPAGFDVKILDAANAILYSGSAIVNYYGHDNGGMPYFQPTDSTYVGAQMYPGKGWGCMMPPGFEIFFTIGSNGFVGVHTFDNKYVLLLPVGYCVFQ